MEGLNPIDYHLAPGEKLNEAINRSWNRLNGLWGAYQAARGRLGQGDAGTTLTRERWLLPLMQELGYGRLSIAKAIEIEGKSYPISHHWVHVPLHLIGCGLDLDKRAPGVAGAARISPHSLLQEYLNRSDEAQWGMLSNGLGLRILRDNATLTRQAYIEFDLESMFDGEIYSDFVLLWLVCHQSRFESNEKQTDCMLERWSKSAQERGTRALDDLRSGVEKAITTLGQGFLQHPLNGDLRTRLKQGELTTQEYYRQLLRLVYRLIFLFAAEDRDLLLLPDTAQEARQRYLNYYSTSRLRNLAQRQRGSRHHDRYEGLRIVFSLLSGEELQRAGTHNANEESNTDESADSLRSNLALPSLGGFLFDGRSTADLNRAKLDNQSLLTAVRSLAFITENNTRRAVDYRNLGPEELGSVYESLLELHPLLNTDAGTFELTSAAGNERKTTGSYYTPTSLIKVLLDSALDPVIQQALDEARRDDTKRAKDAANKADFATLASSRLLALNVCDPACGSGHFLIAAAHRIAGKLAQARAGGDEPAPDETRRALRDVIRHCIYGVDINPMAVELCKVNLWLESIEPGKPLSFLDAHIKCGNSLVGVGPQMDIDELVVPDDAFKAVTGDHKATATLLRKRNKQEREGQEGLFVTLINSQEDLDKWLAERAQAIENMPEDNPAEVQAKAKAYNQINQSEAFRKQKQIADLWTAAFFWKIEEPSGKNFEIVAPTNGQLNRLQRGDQTQAGLLEQIKRIRQSEGFFHWPLEFADVAEQGGFDCVLGNPPWERIKLQEEEFFAIRDPEISNAPNKAARGKLIKKLKDGNPALAQAFEDAKHAAECTSKFVRSSNRFSLTAVGDVNTYALFAEHFRDLMNARGRAGIIVPTGIATDDTTKDFFGDLIEKRSIASLFDFENKEEIFKIHRSYKFCLLTLSGSPVRQASFVFFATRVEHLRDDQRRFTLDPVEIALFNPNTRTMPVFRTRIDAELTRKIYHRVPVLVNERTGENPWGVSFLRMFDMSNDSGLFVTEPREGYVRLYEAKMFWHYDHRWATYDGDDTRELTYEEKKNLLFYITPRYWVKRNEVNNRESTNHNWFLAFRNVTNSTNERSAIFSIIPRTGVGHSAPIIFNIEIPIKKIIVLLGNLCSITFDYFVRQKLGGINMTFGYIRQFPIISSRAYSVNALDFIATRVLELMYSAYDLKPFAEEIGYYGEPFQWDEERRALLRAELDAYYARLYGLTRDELRYILDPQDVYGPDFPGETFRVLKEKEIRQFGEYRTRRLVLEAWDRLEGVEIGPSADGYLEQAAVVAPKQKTTLGVQSKSETMREIAAREEPTTPERKPVVAPEGQPMLADYSLYKCQVCGQRVMGFDQQNHERFEHGGKSVEWKKIE